jgi:hypothetical protein
MERSKGQGNNFIRRGVLSYFVWVINERKHLKVPDVFTVQDLLSFDPTICSYLCDRDPKTGKVKKSINNKAHKVVEHATNIGLIQVTSHRAEQLEGNCVKTRNRYVISYGWSALFIEAFGDHTLPEQLEILEALFQSAVKIYRKNRRDEEKLGNIVKPNGRGNDEEKKVQSKYSDPIFRWLG